MNPTHLAEYIIVPTLDYLEHLSTASLRLVLGTALVESRASLVRQLEDGPALGIYQMEPATHDDIWMNWLQFRPDLANSVLALRGNWPIGAGAMVGNFFYATAMCRIQYLRVPFRLPHWENAKGMASYWKRWYNTPAGLGKEEEAVEWFQKAISLTTIQEL